MTGGVNVRGGIVTTRDLALEISRGNVSGFKSVNKFGRTTNADLNTIRDVWDLTTQAIWTPPTVARVHNIVSTDVNDTAAGTGLRTLRIYGLTDWDTAEVSEDITMNGDTVVPTTNSYVIIHRMQSLTWGGVGVTGPNLGTITATALTDATVTAQINPGEGQTQMAIYGIPSTQTAYMPSYYYSLNRASGSTTIADVQIVINPYIDTQRLGYIVKHTQSIAQSGLSYINHRFDPYLAIPGPAVIKSQVTTSVNDTDVSAGFDLIVVDN